MAQRQTVGVGVKGERQPKTYKLSPKSLLSLPFRLCNPPPAVGKVRSCGVTPVFKVRLEDVLDRKHLPPLGLKDFEEWLLYVELAPENLYFTLWLREYTIKYRQWEAATKSRRQDQPVYLGVWPSHNSTQLAMFYARAKQTFLTPNATYELNLPSDILAPFHTSNGSPHPDPAVFNQVAVNAQRMLQESLQRFVTAQFNNVGNNRVLCGIMAGTFCCMLGALFPLLFTILTADTRWLRITAFPGLWLGLTLLLTSFNGICLGVYVFGDLRQLRKFELSRPAISKPQPFYSSRRTPVAATSIVPSVVPAASDDIDVSSVRSAPTTQGSCDIQISPAYYDMDHVEGPAVSPISYYGTEKHHRSGFDDFDLDESSEEEYPSTALFIHPFDDPSSEDLSLPSSPESYQFPEPSSKEHKRLPEELQRISEFDFDTLPVPVAQRVEVPAAPPAQAQQRVIVVPQTENEGMSPKAFLRRLQSRCNIKRWLVVSEEGTAAGPSIEKQFKKVRAVPAFASPLTKVLNPVVVRGQWEIVVRSMIVAFFMAWIVVGSLLAIPIRG